MLWMVLAGQMVLRLLAVHGYIIPMEKLVAPMAAASHFPPDSILMELIPKILP
jgi:hypothetical protein